MSQYDSGSPLELTNDPKTMSEQLRGQAIESLGHLLYNSQYHRYLTREKLWEVQNLLDSLFQEIRK